MRATLYSACAVMALAAFVTSPVPAAAQAGAKPPAKAKAAPPAATKDVAVTVTYKGKGTVDATHEILVFLFPTPDLGDRAEPLTMQKITKNGGTAVFKEVTTTPVYVAVVYNEKAAYDGTSGPPPAGTPISMHSTDGKVMAPVTPGPKGKIALTFDDSKRR